MNFVIFGQPRTGSTLLVSLLQSHSKIHCDGELFRRKQWRRGWRSSLLPFLRTIPEPYLAWKAWKCTAPAYGFKLIVHQVRSPRRVLANLHWLGWRIIFIERSSLFDLAISRKVARSTQHFGSHQDRKDKNIPSLEIPPQEFMQTLHTIILARQVELETLGKLPYLRVNYEADLALEEKRDFAFQSIFRALGLEPQPVRSTKLRSWQQPYSSLIRNYAELEAALDSPAGQALQAQWQETFQA